jgi:YHS domain-containing protein
MRFVLVALPVFAFAVSCTRTEAPSPVAAPAEPELTAVATPVVDDEASCGNGAACGEEKKAGSCGAHADGPHDATVQAAFDAAPAHGDKALCLVMNREFVVDDRTATSVYEGKTYAFCCDGCKQAFDENPAKYVHADVKATTTQLPPKS